jgi:predicted dehydrogenase
VNGRPVQLGVIGCGNVLTAYGPAMQQLRARGRADCALACGRAAQREFAQAQLGPGPIRFTTKPEEILASAAVDAVVILTSPAQHASLARAALEAGKHVLVEKPFATSLKDARELLECARRHDRLLVCAPFTLLSPTFQILSARLRRGDIGRPCSARARYGWSGPWWSEWFYQGNGGALFDLAIYCLTSLTGLIGPVRRVAAMTGVAIPEREVQGRRLRVEAEDNAQIVLDFGESCFGVVTSGFTLQQYRCPALEIYGTSGTVQMLGDDWAPDGYELWQNAAGCWQVFKETAPDWPWHDGLRHWIECIQGSETPIVTPEQAFHVLEVILKTQQASREGRTLELESRFTPPTFVDAPKSELAHLIHDPSRPR